MENPYEGQNYRPYTPPPVYEPEICTEVLVYQGNATFATLSSGHGNFVYPFLYAAFSLWFLSFRGWAFFFPVCPKENTDVPKCKGGYGISA